jgi:hypothetical protein
LKLGFSIGTQHQGRVSPAVLCLLVLESPSSSGPGLINQLPCMFHIWSRICWPGEKGRLEVALIAYLPSTQSPYKGSGVSWPHGTEAQSLGGAQRSKQILTLVRFMKTVNHCNSNMQFTGGRDKEEAFVKSQLLFPLNAYDIFNYLTGYLPAAGGGECTVK